MTILKSRRREIVYYDDLSMTALPAGNVVVILTTSEGHETPCRVAP